MEHVITLVPAKRVAKMIATCSCGWRGKYEATTEGATRAGDVHQRAMRQLDPTLEPAPFNKLTPRQIFVLRRIACGDLPKLVAEALGVSIKTYASHRAAGMSKVGAKTTAHLVRIAIRARFVTNEPAEDIAI